MQVSRGAPGVFSRRLLSVGSPGAVPDRILAKHSISDNRPLYITTLVGFAEDVLDWPRRNCLTTYLQDLMAPPQPDTRWN